MYFFCPLDVMLVHHKVNPSIKCTITHIWGCVKSGSVRVWCVNYPITHHDVPARDQIPTNQCRIKHTYMYMYHEANVAPLFVVLHYPSCARPDACTNLWIGQSYLISGRGHYQWSVFGQGSNMYTVLFFTHLHTVRCINFLPLFIVIQGMEGGRYCIWKRT